MAGFYPTPPAPRIPYDLDGTMTTAGSLSNANRDNSLPGEQWPVLLLAEPHDIHGFACIMRANYNYRMFFSANTTNGVDGTWTSYSIRSSGSVDTFRREVEVLDPPFIGLSGVRFSDPRLRVLHLYGYPSSPPDGLQIWDVTTNTPRATLCDFENTYIGGTFTRDFRVKNHAAEDAEDITMTNSTNVDTDPSIASMFDITLDGGTTWDTFPATLPDIDAGDISPVYTLRYRPTVTAPLIPAAQRWTIAVGTWV